LRLASRLAFSLSGQSIVFHRVIRIKPVEPLVFDETIHSNALRVRNRSTEGLYRESSKDFLGHTVLDGLAFTALMVLEGLHALQRHDTVTKQGGYLECRCASNGLMGQGSMVSLLDFLVSVVRFTESEHCAVIDLDKEERSVEWRKAVAGSGQLYIPLQGGGDYVYAPWV
jgi:hypothetical protein